MRVIIILIVKAKVSMKIDQNQVFEMHAIRRCRSISSKNNADTSLKVCCIVALEYGWRMDRFLSSTRNIFSAERKKGAALTQSTHTHICDMWLAGKRVRKEKDEMCIEKYWRLLGFALRTKKADPPSSFREHLRNTSN